MARFCRSCGCDVAGHRVRLGFGLMPTQRICPLRQITQEERIARELPAAPSGDNEEAARFVIDRSLLKERDRA